MTEINCSALKESLLFTEQTKLRERKFNLNLNTQVGLYLETRLARLARQHFDVERRGHFNLRLNHRYEQKLRLISLTL